MGVIQGYWAILDPVTDRGWWNVEFRDFPTVFTTGESESEAVSMAKEALDEAVTTIIADHDLCLPKPSGRPRKISKGCRSVFIPLDASVALAAWFVQFRLERGLTQSEMAAKLGIRQQSYARYERPGAINMTVDGLQSILRRLNLDLEIQIQRRSPSRVVMESEAAHSLPS